MVGDGAPPGDLLKMLSSQITSLTSTVEKQQLRLRLMQATLDKTTNEGHDKVREKSELESSLIQANSLLSQAQDRATAAEARAHQAELSRGNLDAEDTIAINGDVSVAERQAAKPTRRYASGLHDEPRRPMRARAKLDTSDKTMEF